LRRAGGGSLPWVAGRARPETAAHGRSETRRRQQPIPTPCHPRGGSAGSVSLTAMTWVAFIGVASQRPPASARLHSLTGRLVGMACCAQGCEVGWIVIVTGAGMIDFGGGGPAQSAAVVSGTQYPGTPGVPVARQARSTVAPMPTQNRPLYIRAALQGPPVV